MASARGTTSESAEADELSTALDGLLEELGDIYAALAQRTARSEVAASNLAATNDRLRTLADQAEVARRPSTPPPEPYDAAQEPGDPGEELAVPAVANIDSVLAAARAIRGQHDAPSGSRAGAGVRSGAASGGRGRAGRGSGRGGTSRGGVVGALPPPGRLPTRPAASRSRSKAGREATDHGRESSGRIASSAHSGPAPPAPAGPATPPAPAPPPPLPSLPKLPKRLQAALQRAQSSSETTGHRRRIATAGGRFVACLSSGFQVPSAEELETQRWQASLRGDGDGGAAVGYEAAKERNNAWLGAHGQRWVCALAMADAQEELARKLDRLAANPDPKALGALGALSEQLQRDWAELQGGAERLRQQGPFNEAVDNMAKWRNRSMQALLAGRTDPEEAAVQQQQPEAAPLPADVWLPAHMLAASAGALQGGGTAAGGAPLWEALLFPGAAALPPEERHAEVVYSSAQQLASLAKARHQLQLHLLQIYLEAGPAQALLPTHGAPARLQPGERPCAQAERYAARIRLAHAFLCRGLDRGACTLATRVLEEP